MDIVFKLAYLVFIPCSVLIIIIIILFGGVSIPALCLHSLLYYLGVLRICFPALAKGTYFCIFNVIYLYSQMVASDTGVVWYCTSS